VFEKCVFSENWILVQGVMVLEGCRKRGILVCRIDVFLLEMMGIFEIGEVSDPLYTTHHLWGGSSATVEVSLNLEGGIFC